jgi:hypothetical protein
LAQPVAYTNLYGPQASTRFAQYLYQTGNYGQAALEYERLMLVTSARNQPLMAKMALRSHRKDGNLAAGEKVALYWMNLATGPQASFTIEYALLLTALGRYDESNHLLHDLGIPETDSMGFIKALNLTYLGDFLPAKDLLKQSSLTGDCHVALQSAIAQGLALKEKKPGLAVGLGVVPGLGKIYTGHYVDAGASILFTGIMAWQAYVGFNHRGTRSVYGWITGSLATGFYLGSLYGSHHAALAHNRKHMESIRNETDRAYHLFI